MYACNSVLGLAWSSFDASISLERHHFGAQFAAKYSVLLHSDRGAGYWAWKPYFLLRVMLEIAEPGDFIFYSDSGCVHV